MNAQNSEKRSKSVNLRTNLVEFRVESPFEFSCNTLLHLAFSVKREFRVDFDWGREYRVSSNISGYHESTNLWKRPPAD